jgi:putative hydrolase of the HAD superfamily
MAVGGDAVRSPRSAGLAVMELSDKGTGTHSGADLRHIKTWIFDLDNTLYHADSNLFVEIELRMTEFIAHRLDVHPGEAYALQHLYYRSYGSTLSGLVQCDGVDPEEFLSYIHDIDLSPLRPDPALRTAVMRLPGRRAIFTNGCRNHAERVLKQIGLEGLWDDVWDIRTLGYVPKPQPQAYTRIVEIGGFDPTAAAMFEDMARNLVPAFDLGMTTIFIQNTSRWTLQGPDVAKTPHHHIHHEIDDLANFLQTIRL